MKEKPVNKIFYLLFLFGLLGCTAVKPNNPVVMTLTEKDSGKSFPMNAGDMVVFNFKKPADNDIFWRIAYVDLESDMGSEEDRRDYYAFTLKVNGSGKIAFELFDFVKDKVNTTLDYTFDVKNGTEISTQWSRQPRFP